MALGPIPPKSPIPERVREPLSGRSKNAELRAAILERDRAKLVVMYRRSGSPWPDGIDSKSDRWYGDGNSWTEERIKAALDDAVFEGRLKSRPKVVVVPEDVVVKAGRPSVVDAPNTLTAKEPWAEAGMSRSAWYRRRDKREGG